MVLQSIYCDPQTNNEMQVAVKGLKGKVTCTYLVNTIFLTRIWILFLASNSTLKDVENFLEECSKMKNFNHPNVLPLIGVSFDKESNPAMVLPFVNNGDVKAYLLSQRVSDTDVDTFPPVMCSLF